MIVGFIALNSPSKNTSRPKAYYYRAFFLLEPLILTLSKKTMFLVGSSPRKRRWRAVHACVEREMRARSRRR